MLNKEKIIFNLERLIGWGILFYCVSVPFSIAASQAGIITALVSWLLLALLNKKFLWKKNLMTVPIAVFLATQILSVIFSIDVGRSLHELRSYWHILIFFLVLNCAGAELLKKGIILTIASASVASLFGIGQYVFTRFIVGGLMGQHRISGTISMYMTYSGILMITAIMALALFLYGTSARRERLLAFGALALILFTLVLSLTRSAWLGFIAGIVVIGIVKDRRLLLLLALGVTLAFFLAPKDVRERAKELVKGKKTVVENNVVVYQGDERMELWKAGIEVIRHNPVTGVGLLNFRKAYPQYLPYKPMKNFNHAHNNFIHLGAETGLLGLLSFAAMLLVYLVYLIKRSAKVSPGEKSFEGAVVVGMLGSFVAFVVTGLFEYNFGDSEIAMLLWFLMAAPFVFQQRDIAVD